MFRGKGGPLCRKVRGMLSEYIDNSLSGENKSLVERHIETCEACSKELESLRMTVRLLGRVSQSPVPRSFTLPVPEPRRESVFVPSGLRLPRPATAVAVIAIGPTSLRWLRPATAIVAIVLVVLLMGDFLHAFENNAGVNSGRGDATYVQLAPSYAATEQQTMVTVPGIMGQMSLATAKAVGYTEYAMVPSSPVSQPITQPIPSVLGDEGPTGAQVIVRGEAGVGWPLRQTEIGLGAVVFVLLALIIFARRQRTKGIGAG